MAISTLEGAEALGIKSTSNLDIFETAYPPIIKVSDINVIRNMSNEITTFNPINPNKEEKPNTIIADIDPRFTKTNDEPTPTPTRGYIHRTNLKPLLYAAGIGFGIFLIYKLTKNQ